MRRHGRLEQHDPGLGHVALVTALKGDRDSGRLEPLHRLRCGVLHAPEVTGHGRVQDDRHIRIPDLVDDEVGLGGAVEDEVDPELPLEPERRKDLAHPVRGDQRADLAVEKLAQDLHSQVAGWSPLSPGLTARSVFPGLDELLTHQRHALGAGARTAAEGAGDFRSQRHGDHGDWRHRGLVHRDAARLDDHRLAAHESARRVARVQGGHTEVPDPIDQILPCVVGVHRSQLRLEGAG